MTTTWRSSDLDGSPRLRAADQLGVIAADVARLMDAHGRTLLGGTGVEGSAMRIMGEVVHARAQELRPSELAGLLRVDLSTISRQLKAAGGAGLVSVVTDPQDRRASLVRLTPTGLVRYREIRGRRAALLAQLLDGWDDAGVDQLVTVLSDLVDSLRVHDPAPTSST